MALVIGWPYIPEDCQPCAKLIPGCQQDSGQKENEKCPQRQTKRKG